MNIIKCEQGSLEWMQARLGLPTASQFDRILTPKGLKPSTSRFTYKAELVAEWLIGQPLEWGSIGFMERGQELEEKARRWYEFEQNVDVRQVGFVTRDDGAAGCSPDGLIEPDGGLEIKCPGAARHVRYMLGEDPDYIGQVQGSLFLTGRSWWDVLSYHPDLPAVLVRVEPDLTYFEALRPVLAEFIETLETAKARLAEYRQVKPWEMEAGHV